MKHKCAIFGICFIVIIFIACFIIWSTMEVSHVSMSSNATFPNETLLNETLPNETFSNGTFLAPDKEDEQQRKLLVWITLGIITGIIVLVLSAYGVIYVLKKFTSARDEDSVHEISFIQGPGVITPRENQTEETSLASEPVVDEAGPLAAVYDQDTLDRTAERIRQARHGMGIVFTPSDPHVPT